MHSFFFFFNVELVAPYCNSMAHMSVSCTKLSARDPTVPTSVLPGTLHGGTLTAGWIGGAHMQPHQNLAEWAGQVLQSPYWRNFTKSPIFCTPVCVVSPRSWVHGWKIGTHWTFSCSCFKVLLIFDWPAVVYSFSNIQVLPKWSGDFLEPRSFWSLVI